MASFAKSLNALRNSFLKGSCFFPHTATTPRVPLALVFEYIIFENQSASKQRGKTAAFLQFPSGDFTK